MVANRIEFIAGKRKTLKGQITSLTNALAQNKIDKINAQLRLDRLTELFRAYEDLHEELETLDDQEEDVAQMEGIRDNYYSVASKIKAMLNVGASRDISIIENPTHNSTLNTTAIIEKQKQLKLPVAELPNFEGDHDKWLSYKNTFLSMVHTRTDIDNLTKLLYLKSSLKGAAFNKLALFDVSADNYEKAWKLLIDSYEKKRILVSKHMDAILSITPATVATSKDLSRIIDEARQHLNMLDSLGIAIDRQFVVRILERKLPIEIQQKWEESLTLDVVPQLQQFGKFIDETCFRLCQLEQSTTINKNLANNKRRGDRDWRASKSQKTNSGARAFITPTSITCVKCSGNHPMYKCEEFEKLAVQERWDFIKANGLCRNCLRAHIGECTSSRCKRCNRFHHTLLHAGNSKQVQNNKAFNPKPTPAKNEPTNSKPSA